MYEVSNFYLLSSLGYVECYSRGGIQAGSVVSCDSEFWKCPLNQMFISAQMIR